MKKTTLFITLSMIASLMFAKAPKYDLDYDVPQAFDESPVIDLQTYNCKGVNSVSVTFYANKANIITLYGNNPISKEWEKIASCDLKGFSDKDYESFLNKDALNWRYFTFKPENQAELSYKIQISGKILKVEIRPKGEDFDTSPLPKINLSDAYVFDIKKIRAEDYLVFKNFTKCEELKCVPYYFDKKTYKWCHSFENATVKENAKIELIDDEEIDGIPYIAVQVIPQGNYSFKLYEKNNDLFIEISDENPSESDDINFIKE
ncbi:hypothetical protein [Treponema sp. C6A8]|uniref:hypothetical protein n=1 Tax=Treponema sp. C6A8 TaxID=1410609 RepID=UPI0004817A65|nr:hypothetical protein [Treponema sp. C6A8]